MHSSNSDCSSVRALHSVTADRRRRGLSLVEVVVGLTLMATLLVSTLVAYSGHRRQLRRAEQKRVAVTVADRLLVEMSGTLNGIPLSSQGYIAGHPTWFWRTSPIGIVAPMQIPMTVVRLQIVESVGAGSTTVLASVDVVEGGR